ASPGLPDRSPGAVHGPHDAGDGREHDHRDHLREPLPPRPGARPHGRRHPRRRQPGDRARPVRAVGSPGHGDGPAGERLPGARRARGARDDAGRARLPPRPGLRARRGEAPSSRGRHPARGGRPVTDLVCTSGSAAARRRLARLERRGEAAGARVEADVRRIIEAVRRRGDRALLAFTRRFDGVSLRRGELRVPDGALARAYRKQPPSVRRDLALAARRIRAFHARQRERSWSFRDATGARLGQRIEPLARVGVYIPGGRAVYPSTVLMTVVTARVAGVREVIAVTPAQKGGDHPLDNPLILAACHVAGVDRLYRLGGAQAIAALAFGTETVPRVDKIVGPGNIYVATAKRLCYGHVAIDAIAGPSEVVIVADRSADPELVAAGVRHAGAVFLGQEAPEALGDYLAGPNHVLPTGGTARFASPLGVYDFVKRTSVIGAGPRTLATLGPPIVRLARLEGLDAHGRAVERRLAAVRGGNR